jgi:zinc protease
MAGSRNRFMRSAVPLAALIFILLWAAGVVAGNVGNPAAGAATSKAAGEAAAIPRIEFDAMVTTLENGLKVILLEDHSAPVISRYTFFRVGSRNERPGITGISHFMEHMMFNGAEKYGPKEFDRVLEANGGTSNAFTSKDMTAYYEDIASDILELSFDLDSDRIRSLALDPKYIESEMGVVMEERLSSIDNSIDGSMYEELYALAFKAHPYRWPVLGWMSDLEGIDREDCVRYFRTYYAPNNAVLIVAGDFDSDEALELIRSYYGDIPAQAPPAPVRTVEPEQWGERRAEVRKAAELPAVMIAYHVPGMRSDDFFALEMLQGILTTGRSSRLYRLLVREMEIALSIDIDYAWRIDPDLFTFSVRMKPGHTTAEAEEAVYAAIDSLVADGVTGEELSRARKQIAVNFVRRMQTVNGKAYMIGRTDLLLGDYRELFRLQEGYAAVTADDVKRVAETYLRPARRSVVTLVPEVAEE